MCHYYTDVSEASRSAIDTVGGFRQDARPSVSHANGVGLTVFSYDKRPHYWANA